uniref:Uncharacterized protein n=1 Tax=Steinernema glaseri TaxID=37863 RepID=A0A1I8A178_9BILA
MKDGKVDKVVDDPNCIFPFRSSSPSCLHKSKNLSQADKNSEHRNVEVYTSIEFFLPKRSVFHLCQAPIWAISAQDPFCGSRKRWLTGDAAVTHRRTATSRQLLWRPFLLTPSPFDLLKSKEPLSKRAPKRR